MKRFLILSGMVVGIMVGTSSAFAGFSWPQLPLACLPERAAKWQDGKVEAQQEACHCPPTDMCPATYEEYRDNSKAQMPMSFVLRCCPAIENPHPTCPDGLPVSSSGECPVITTGCPMKFYPSLAQSGITSGGNFSNKYTEKSVAYDFRKDCGAKQNGIICIPMMTDYIYVLDKLYGFSFRTRFTNWLYGPMFGGVGSKAYSSITGGAVTGYQEVTDLLPTLAADEFTWFGISIGKIGLLPDNLATPEVVSIFSSRDLVQISEKGRTVDTFGLASKSPDFFNACKGVLGEYATLHYETVGGQSCPYLQCRYVWSWAGESCLAASARVTLADGTKKAASELTVGDKVRTGNGTGKVTATNRYQSGLRVLYGINGSEALLTGDHPVRTTDGWKVIAEDAVKLYVGKPGFARTALAVGDTLVTETGEVKVEGIERFAEIDPVSTYNIKVEGGQGFYADGFEVKGFDRMEMQYK